MFKDFELKRICRTSTYNLSSQSQVRYEHSYSKPLYLTTTRMTMGPARRHVSDNKDAASLGQALKFEFSGQTARNRFLKGAMTELLSSWDADNVEARGVPSEDLVNLYRIFGQGDIGLMLSGNIMIDHDHLEAAGNAIIPRGSIFSGARFEAFKRMAAAAKMHGSLFIGQVSHPGRQVKSNIQKHPISASDVQLEGNILGSTFEKPRAATKEDITNVVEGFTHFHATNKSTFQTS